jgi:hypothetical protein
VQPRFKGRKRVLASNQIRPIRHRLAALPSSAHPELSEFSCLPNVAQLDGPLPDPDALAPVRSLVRSARIERVVGRLFEGEEAVLHVIERIVAPLGLRVDATSPWVDARLPDGSRVQTRFSCALFRGVHRLGAC